MFNYIVAQKLFTRIQCNKDAQTSIAFLTTIVINPDKGDWKELRRLLGYLKIMIELPLILRSDGANVQNWWFVLIVCSSWRYAGEHKRNYYNGERWLRIDNQYIEEAKAKHNDIEGGEIIGAYNAMPQILWTRYFLESQGYGINKNIL